MTTPFDKAVNSKRHPYVSIISYGYYTRKLTIHASAFQCVVGCLLCRIFRIFQICRSGSREKKSNNIQHLCKLWPMRALWIAAVTLVLWAHICAYFHFMRRLCLGPCFTYENLFSIFITIHCALCYFLTLCYCCCCAYVELWAFLRV